MKATLKAAFVGAGALFAGVILAGPLLAGPERIAFPEGFETDWVLYNQVDRPDRKRIRFMYVKPEADAAAVPGEPARMALCSSWPTRPPNSTPTRTRCWTPRAG